MKASGLFRLLFRVGLLALVIYFLCTSAGIWAVLIIAFFVIRFILRLFVSVLYSRLIAAVFIALLLTFFNVNMESLNKNGVSTTQELGQEKYVTFIAGAFRGTEYFQYDYRHTRWGTFLYGSQNARRVPETAG